MGLDIKYAARVKRADLTPGTDEYDAFDGLHIWSDPAFPDQADGLTEGVYEAEDEGGFRAGSYGGYNRWRERLSMLALAALPNTVWDNPARFAGKPFVDLIHFSDCEGVIGPKTSAKLAADFDAYIASARSAFNEYELQVYENFRTAFHTAAGDGAVMFA